LKAGEKTALPLKVGTRRFLSLVTLSAMFRLSPSSGGTYRVAWTQSIELLVLRVSRQNPVSETSRVLNKNRKMDDVQ
jgi:hypothetical protein